MNPLSLHCPHCGEIDWSRAPRLRHAFEFVRSLPSPAFHARQYREASGLSPQSVTNAMRDLERLGLIARTGTDCNPTGGVEIAWVRLAAPADAPARPTP